MSTTPPGDEPPRTTHDPAGGQGRAPEGGPSLVKGEAGSSERPTDYFPPAGADAFPPPPEGGYAPPTQAYPPQGYPAQPEPYAQAQPGGHAPQPGDWGGAAPAQGAPAQGFPPAGFQPVGFQLTPQGQGYYNGMLIGSRLRRFGARLLDGVFAIPVYLLAYFVIFVLVLATASTTSSDTTDDTGETVAVILFVVAIYIVLPLAANLTLAAFLARKGERNGQTLGKQVLDLRVVTESGAPLTFGRAAAREALMPMLYVLTLGIAGLVDLVYPLFDAQKRRLADVICKTVVVAAVPRAATYDPYAPAGYAPQGYGAPAPYGGPPQGYAPQEYGQPPQGYSQPQQGYAPAPPAYEPAPPAAHGSAPGTVPLPPPPGYGPAPTPSPEERS